MYKVILKCTDNMNTRQHEIVMRKKLQYLGTYDDKGESLNLLTT